MAPWGRVLKIVTPGNQRQLVAPSWREWFRQDVFDNGLIGQQRRIAVVAVACRIVNWYGTILTTFRGWGLVCIVCQDIGALAFFRLATCLWRPSEYNPTIT